MKTVIYPILVFSFLIPVHSAFAEETLDGVIDAAVPVVSVGTTVAAVVKADDFSRQANQLENPKKTEKQLKEYYAATKETYVKLHQERETLTKMRQMVEQELSTVPKENLAERERLRIKLEKLEGALSKNLEKNNQIVNYLLKGWGFQPASAVDLQKISQLKNKVKISLGITAVSGLVFATDISSRLTGNGGLVDLSKSLKRAPAAGGEEKKTTLEAGVEDAQ